MSFEITRPFLSGSGAQVNYLRITKFLCVGAFCTVLQYLVFFTIIQAFSLDQWWQATVVNATAFVVSTQVNYLLSYHITWHDRKSAGSWSPYEVSSLLRFNLMALTSLGANTIVFGLIILVANHPLALISGTAAGLLLTFAASHKFVFKHRRPRTITVGGT